MARSAAQRAFGVVSTVVVALIVALAVVLVGVRLFGLQTYVVLSGSMEPTLPTGSLVYVQPVDASNIKEGDAITFDLGDDTIVTHRVVDVIDNGGAPSFRTKGDANRVEDGHLVTANEVVGKAVFSIPGLGRAAEFVHTRYGRIVAIGIGLGLVLLVALPSYLLSDKGRKDDPPASAASTAAAASAAQPSSRTTCAEGGEVIR